MLDLLKEKIEAEEARRFSFRLMCDNEIKRGVRPAITKRQKKVKLFGVIENDPYAIEIEECTFNPRPGDIEVE